jgi:hypothetical protein
MAVKFAITTVIHASEDNTKTTDSMNTSLLKDNKDLVKNLARGFSGNTKDWVDIWVVATATSRNTRSKFDIINLSVTISIKFAEQCLDLSISENASKSLECLLKLSWLNSAEALKIEMLEDFLCSFAFIISTMSALSDLLENSIFELLKTINCNVSMSGLLSTDSPSLENKLYKVVVLLSRKSSINIRVVLNESILSD